MEPQHRGFGLNNNSLSHPVFMSLSGTILYFDLIISSIEVHNSGQNLYKIYKIVLYGAVIRAKVRVHVVEFRSILLFARRGQ